MIIVISRILLFFLLLNYDCYTKAKSKLPVCVNLQMIWKQIITVTKRNRSNAESSGKLLLYEHYNLCTRFLFVGMLFSTLWNFKILHIRTAVNFFFVQLTHVHVAFMFATPPAESFSGDAVSHIGKKITFLIQLRCCYSTLVY